MKEWTRQCGYDLSLVRYYPHDSSLSAQPSPAPSPSRPFHSYPDRARPVSAGGRGGGDSERVRKVRHAHRVERLIHLELAECRVKRDCATCGKEHREWFEIEATENGVKEVDEIIKRWVRWSDTVE